jgi:CheY-like chemotaxis protein
LSTPVRILLIEDTPEDVHHFTALVGKKATVFVAETGAEALDRLFRRGRFHADPSPDLVVIDLNVPLLTGHEVLNVIRANSETRHLPVIVYSVSDNPSDIVKAYELGACAYMVKPMDLSHTESQLNAFSEFWLTNVRYASVTRSKSA